MLIFAQSMTYDFGHHKLYVTQHLYVFCIKNIILLFIYSEI